jgi:hypothetical protein
MHVGPWTIVCLIGFVLYAIVGWVHGGGGERSLVYDAVAVALLAAAAVQLFHPRRTKPPKR